MFLPCRESREEARFRVKWKQRRLKWESRMDSRDKDMEKEKRTAGEAGWHVSRYNVSAKIPGEKATAIVNLMKGTCAKYNPMELYLLSVLEELDENHPIIERFARRGIITRMDERAALELMGRGACMASGAVSLTVCPTMNCNFDCPYCFEGHRPGKMSPEVQEDVICLAERMLKAGKADLLSVTWFGGEPLLAVDVIEGLSERLIRLAEEYHARYEAEIVTNGYLLNRKNIEILERCRVGKCQITIDGIGAAHDATRHLAGGGATFDRIIRNIRDERIPFQVSIRQNVQESNVEEIPRVREYVRLLREESGNDIVYHVAAVQNNETAAKRGMEPRLLCKKDLMGIEIADSTDYFEKGKGHYCGAHVLWSVGIDEKGNLFKCWEAVADTACAFATARDWDPLNPLETAFAPDKLTMYMNTALPTEDEECRECVWLPACTGGCPHKRLFYQKDCLSFRDHPEEYVLSLYGRLKAKS